MRWICLNVRFTVRNITPTRWRATPLPNVFQKPMKNSAHNLSPAPENEVDVFKCEVYPRNLHLG